MLWQAICNSPSSLAFPMKTVWSIAPPYFGKRLYHYGPVQMCEQQNYKVYKAFSQEFRLECCRDMLFVHLERLRLRLSQLFCSSSGSHAGFHENFTNFTNSLLKDLKIRSFCSFPLRLLIGIVAVGFW
jgi:hypothetical protein